MKWEATAHSANATDEYLFHQLIPYIGNKRKLLGLIERTLNASDATPETHSFIDLFAGTGVVSRMAKQKGFTVLANDWEPYSEVLNRCYIETDKAPLFFGKESYHDIIQRLNDLPDREDWVTQHLCPIDDAKLDHEKDRLFYMRKNGRRIDAIRHQIDVWDQAGDLSVQQRACLLAPLLYQCCYNANTSGVFKGFHRGWGGQTGTALYRIMGDVVLRPALFHQNAHRSTVTRMDAFNLAKKLKEHHADKKAFVYLDPPYNQHPYGSNYHVLNSVTLWDKPSLPERITGRGDKAAIRTDWREGRRSAYNYRHQATEAYRKLLQHLKDNAAWVATSYSTDGTIPLREMIEANGAIGNVRVFTQPYKRYRVSSQRYSERSHNIEFVLLTQTEEKTQYSTERLLNQIAQTGEFEEK
ncbi:MAG: DNA methyltransferase [Proteobacteria bacterium]|jgi:adenine-specific DNA-methyltransferase|nr:DNA adenine methylase [Alphaproteobacteria bacterium]NCC04114.1 DNA methyltransferase [Pseudomonadota bacterium]